MKLVRFAIMAGILYFLARALTRNWAGINHDKLTWDPVAITLALALLIVLQNIFLGGWMLTLRTMRLSLPWARAFATYHKSQIMRFVPGNVWHVIGRTYMASQDGLPPALVFGSMALENALILAAAILVFAFMLPFGASGPDASLWYFTLIPPIALSVYPPVLSRIINTGLRIARKPGIQILIPYRIILALASYHFAARCAGGLAMYLVISAIHPLPVSTIPAVIGIHALSFVIGFVSFITPSGIGVREAASAYLLAVYMPFPTALMISLVLRVVWMLSELINAGAAVLVARVSPARLLCPVEAPLTEV